MPRARGIGDPGTSATLATHLGTRDGLGANPLTWTCTPAMPEQSPHTPPCALVVDDDALIRMDAAAILEDAGFVTLEAAHADAALELLRERHPHLSLLFTDVQMPGDLDGFALEGVMNQSSIDRRD